MSESWIQWVLGIVASIFLGGAGFWANATYKRITEMSESLGKLATNLEKHAATTTVEIDVLKVDVGEIRDEQGRMWGEIALQGKAITRIDAHMEARQ